MSKGAILSKSKGQGQVKKGNYPLFVVGESSGSGVGRCGFSILKSSASSGSGLSGHFSGSRDSGFKSLVALHTSGKYLSSTML